MEMTKTVSVRELGSSLRVGDLPPLRSLIPVGVERTDTVNLTRSASGRYVLRSWGVLSGGWGRRDVRNREDVE